MPVRPVPRLGSREPRITSGFEWRSNGKFHWGIDILYPYRSGDPVSKETVSPSGKWFHPWGIPAISVMGGRVELVERLSTGLHVQVDHGGGLKTQYIHLDASQPLVRVGQWVREGQPVGVIKYNTKYGTPQLIHLHFQVRKNGVRVDPEPYWNSWRSVPNPWVGDPLWIAAAGALVLLL